MNFSTSASKFASISDLLQKAFAFWMAYSLFTLFDTGFLSDRLLPLCTIRCLPLLSVPPRPFPTSPNTFQRSCFYGYIRLPIEVYRYVRNICHQNTKCNIFTDFIHAMCGEPLLYWFWRPYLFYCHTTTYFRYDDYRWFGLVLKFGDLCNLNLCMFLILIGRHSICEFRTHFSLFSVISRIKYTEWLVQCCVPWGMFFQSDCCYTSFRARQSLPSFGLL